MTTQALEGKKFHGYMVDCQPGRMAVRVAECDTVYHHNKLLVFINPEKRYEEQVPPGLEPGMDVMFGIIEMPDGETSMALNLEIAPMQSKRDMHYVIGESLYQLSGVRATWRKFDRLNARNLREFSTRVCSFLETRLHYESGGVKVFKGAPCTLPEYVKLFEAAHVLFQHNSNVELREDCFNILHWGVRTFAQRVAQLDEEVFMWHYDLYKGYVTSGGPDKYLQLTLAWRWTDLLVGIFSLDEVFDFQPTFDQHKPSSKIIIAEEMMKTVVIPINVLFRHLGGESKEASFVRPLAERRFPKDHKYQNMWVDEVLAKIAQAV